MADSQARCELFCSLDCATSQSARLAAHLGRTAVAESLLCEAAAALDVLLPLEERGKLGLQDLPSGKWEKGENKVRYCI